MKEIASLFYLGCTILCSLLFVNSIGEYNSYFLFLPVTLGFVFIFFKSTINQTVDWFSLDVVFLGLFYLIHFGFLFCYELNLVEYDSEVFSYPLYMNSTILLATAAISSYLLGFSLISPKTEYKLLDFYNKKEDGLWLFSKFLLIIVILMFWLPILSILDLALSDYENLIEVGQLSSIGKLYWVGQYLAVFALIIFFLKFYKNKRNSYLLKNKKIMSLMFILALFYILCYFAIGDRGGFLYYIIIPILACHYFYKKINIKKNIILVFFVLFSSSVVSVSRVSSTYNPIEAYKLYSEAEHKDNPVVEAFTEFGKSIKTVNIIIANIPMNYDYWYGKSYFDSLLIAFPNFFSNRSSQGIDAWLTNTFFGKDTYGRGGSMLMESYGNFGYLGSLLFFNLLGVFSAYLYRRIKITKSLIYFLFYIAFAASICIWMRNTSSYLFRTLIWTVLLYYIGIFLISYLPKKVKVKK